MKGRVFQLKDYGMSSEIGCLVPNPLSRLPPYFDPWKKIVGSLLDLLKYKELRDEVHKLPLLDHEKLQGYRQLCLAHVQLAYITAGYVWQDGDAGVARTLPKSIAIPFFNVALKLGLQPVISIFDVSLANWELLDPNGNLRCLCDIPGGTQGNHFCLVTTDVEIQFGRCLNPMVSALNLLAKRKRGDALGEHDEGELLANLETIARGIGGMKKALGRMHDGLEGHTFFNDTRPFLAGWGGSGTALPDGLIYEGVSNDPLKYRGGSGGQSATLQLLDAFLGVIHSKDEKKYKEMRECMLPPYARFIDDVEMNPAQLAEYVRSSASNPAREAYNACLKSLNDYRSYHLGMISKYILMPNKTSNSGNYDSLNNLGTGGMVVSELKRLRIDVKNRMIPTESSKSKNRTRTDPTPSPELKKQIESIGTYALYLASVLSLSFYCIWLLYSWYYG